MSRFSELLTNEKIDPRRLLIASAAIERLRPEDRRARFLKRNKKAGDAPPAEKTEGEVAPATKPRSGRVITRETLRRAQEGLPLSGPEKTRLVRAVNRVLEQKKKETVDVRKLFPSDGSKKAAQPAAEAAAES
jgi:hypothetical protein